MSIMTDFRLILKALRSIKRQFRLMLSPHLHIVPPMQTFVPLCPMSHRWDKWDKWDKWDNRRPTGDGRYLERKQSDKPKSIEIH